MKIDFEGLYKDYQDLKQSLNDIVQVIIAKDMEWDMKSVLAAVETQQHCIDDKTKNALEAAVDKIKARGDKDDILRSTLGKSATRHDEGDTYDRSRDGLITMDSQLYISKPILKDDYKSYNIDNENKSYQSNNFNTKFNNNSLIEDNKQYNYKHSYQNDQEYKVKDDSVFDKFNIDYSFIDYNNASKQSYKNNSSHLISNNSNNLSTNISNHPTNNIKQTNQNNISYQSLKNESNNNKNNSKYKYKNKRRDDSIELFKSHINYSNCNITKSFDSEMTENEKSNNNYTKQRYETILNSTNDNKYFSDGNDNDDNAHSFIGKLQDIKSALNNSKRLIDSFDNNCIDYDIDEVNGNYQDLRQSKGAHHKQLVENSKSYSHTREIPKGIMSTKRGNGDFINNSNNNSKTRYTHNLNYSKQIDISDIKYDNEDYSDINEFSGGYYHNNDFRNRTLGTNNNHCKSDYFKPLVDFDSQSKPRNNNNDLYSMERSFNKSNQLRDSTNDLINTLNKSKTSSEKKVRFDDSFVSTVSRDKENVVKQKGSIKSEKKSIGKNINKSISKKVNNINLNGTNEIKQSKNNKMRLYSATIKLENEFQSMNLYDHFKKFEILGTGSIKLSKKNKSFTKNKCKGINACLRYPITLNSGVKSFKFQIVSELEDPDSLITFMFERPYKSNYICKTRMMKNGVGITSAGQSFGQYNNLRCDYSLQSGDFINCIADFQQNVVMFTVNDVTVYEAVLNLEQAYLIVYLKCVNDAVKLIDVCL
eukprot:Mrub_01014.p1 GENE.Mrub_01014~~Mrub_01014.p1  ORF type:complete len:815 (+),score=157.53 Mrub_01014:166-2445(+)